VLLCYLETTYRLIHLLANMYNFKNHISVFCQYCTDMLKVKLALAYVGIAEKRQSN